jgi:glycolate oxidase iron-sulfur subunit
VAVQSPCSLQHGQQIIGVVESVLEGLGATLVPVAEGHLCCGSAGSYSIMQPAIADELRQRKIAHLERGEPDVIVTSNVGCQLHLSAATDTPVLHWVELAERLLGPHITQE